MVQCNVPGKWSGKVESLSKSRDVEIDKIIAPDEVSEPTNEVEETEED